jgi:PAS domain S-box-containing protein
MLARHYRPGIETRERAVSAGRAESSAQIANPLVQASLLGEAVDAADIAILVSDEDGRCIAVNQGACDLLGYSRDALLELEVRDFAPDVDAGECFRAVYASGRTDGVIDAVLGDGSRLPIRHVSTPTRVAQMRLVLSFGRADTPAAA